MILRLMYVCTGCVMLGVKLNVCMYLWMDDVVLDQWCNGSYSDFAIDVCRRCSYDEVPMDVCMYKVNDVVQYVWC